MFEVPFRLTGQTGSIALALTSSLHSPRSLLSSPCLYDLYLPLHTLPHIVRPSMATNVTAAAAHIAYDMLPPESLHRTKYQIKAKKNQDLEHTELEMLITMNVHIPLPNPFPDNVSVYNSDGRLTLPLIVSVAINHGML